MEAYTLGAVLHSCAGLQVFEAEGKKRKGSLIVKQYACYTLAEADSLLKEAVVRIVDDFPLWAALREIAFCSSRSENRFPFTANLVYEKLTETLSESFLSGNERGRLPAKYSFGMRIYQRKETQVQVFEATCNSTPVVAKVYGPAICMERCNPWMAEALTQARASHRHCTRLLDTALLEDGGVHVCLFMERLSADLEKDIANRAHNRYSESDLLEFARQMAIALVHTKAIVRTSQGIAHRDIKPANIFLSAEGYKLGDFGSAWANRPMRVRRSTQHNLTESVGGTLLYMSPEMRSLALAGTDTVDAFASDVYSLGMTVLHMAKLQPPVALDVSDRTVLMDKQHRELEQLQYSPDLIRLIRKMLNVDPQRRISAEKLLQLTDKEGCSVKSCVRQVADSTEHERHLRKQQRCLERTGPSPELFRIYIDLSAAALRENAADAAEELLQKALSILQHFPSDPATAYVYSCLSSIYLHTHRLDEAERCLRVTQGIVQRLGDLNDYAGYSITTATLLSAMGRLTEARNLLHQVLGVLPESHDMVGLVCFALARVYMEAGQFAVALELWQKALPLLQKDFSHLAEAYCCLADCYSNFGLFSESVECIEEVVRLQQINLPSTHPNCAAIYSRLGLIYFKMQCFDEAIEMGEKALSITQIHYQEDDPLIAERCWNLAIVYPEIGEFELSAEYCERAIRTSPRGRCVGHWAAFLGRVYSRMGNTDKAREFARLAVSAGVACSESCFDVAVQFANLGVAHMEIGEVPEAAESLLKAVELLKSLSPHALLGNCYSNLSTLYQGIGQLENAMCYSDQALRVWQQTLPEGHLDVLTHYINSAQLLRSVGKPLESIERALSGIRLLQRKGLARHPYFVDLYTILAEASRDLGRLEDAEEAAHRARSLLPEDHPQLAVSCSILAGIYLLKSRFPEAVKFARKALACMQPTHSKLVLASTHCYLARALIPLRKDFEVYKHLRLVLSVIEQPQNVPENIPETGFLFNNLAMLCYEMDMIKKAEECANKALRVFQLTRPEAHSETGICYYNLASISWRLGKRTEAKEYCRHAARILKITLSESHPYSVAAEAFLASMV